MSRAVWNGAVLAESGRTVKLEGDHYFPPGSLQREYVTASPLPVEGPGRYYHVTVVGTTNRDAARYYPRPTPAARMIAGHVAFWHRVRVERVPGPGEDTAGGTGRGLAGRILARLHWMGTQP